VARIVTIIAKIVPHTAVAHPVLDHQWEIMALEQKILRDVAAQLINSESVVLENQKHRFFLLFL
jgi:hypothetical protein